MCRPISKSSVATVLAVALTATASLVRGEDAYSNREVTGDMIAADILLARPAGLVATVVGTAIFIVGLPFTLINGDTELAAQKLVVEPANYTFRRPLGEGIKDP
jgi:hypothetical protein